MERAERHGFVQIGLSVRPSVAETLDSLAEETGWSKVKTLEVALDLLNRHTDKQQAASPWIDDLLRQER